jgi:hypothetical protein
VEPVGVAVNDERHNGRVGDAYLVSEEMAARSKSSAGYDVRCLKELRARDVIVRIRHSADCFCEYRVFREGVPLFRHWIGYDNVFTEGRDKSYIGNVVESMVRLPTGFYRKAEL